jgi:hypothetical protein
MRIVFGMLGQYLARGSFLLKVKKKAKWKNRVYGMGDGGEKTM